VTHGANGAEATCRSDALITLAACLVRSSLTPIDHSEIRRATRQLLDSAWAVVTRAEIDAAIGALDELSDIRRDARARYFTRSMSRSLSDVEDHLSRAREAALAVSNTEGAIEKEIRSRQMSALLGRPLLTAEGERSLAWRIGRGDSSARNEMVEANTRLVLNIAQRWSGRRSAALDEDDLFQEGCIGLIRAAEKFDASRGFKFSTYATWWVRQGVTRAVANKSRTIRIPVHVVDRLAKLVKTERSLRVQLGRGPSDDELAHNLTWSEGLVRETREAAVEVISLDEGVGESAFVDRTVGSTEDMVIERTTSAEAEKALTNLSARERFVLERRLGIGFEPETLEMIGDQLGLTRERVRQIQREALTRLETALGA
jgi:RNA polymerase primary sigma factor